MPITGFTTDCAVISVADGTKCISFPGGAEICMTVPSAVPVTVSEQLSALFGQLNTAMAPLQPVFNIIEAVIAIFKCICAIATLNPFKIARCIPNLAEKVDKLLKLIPQLSIPIMVKEFVDHLITFFDETIKSLERLNTYNTRLLEALQIGQLTDIDLEITIECAQGQAEATLKFINEQAKPINQLIGLINAFLQLIGLPCIPTLTSADLSEGYLDTLASFREFLQTFSDLITIPLPKIPLSVDSEDC